MFMTDGDQACKNSAGLDIDDKSVIDRIIRTKVRIITVAIGLVFSILLLLCLSIIKCINFCFRSDSDPRLEYLAEISGGKTYFVKDGEIHQIFVLDNFIKTIHFYR